MNIDQSDPKEEYDIIAAGDGFIFAVLACKG